MALSGVFDMGKWHTPFDDQVFRQAIERGLDPGLTAQAMPGNSDPQMRATHGAMTDGDWGDLIDSSMLVQTVRRVFWSAIVLAAVALARPALRASWVALMRRRASAPPGKTHRARAAAHVPAFLEVSEHAEESESKRVAVSCAPSTTPALAPCAVSHS